MKSALCRLAPLVWIVLLGSVGCSVDAEKINAWKKTRRGAAKLRYAVLDQELDIGLRKQAALALAEINFVDYLVKDLPKLAGKARQVIARHVVESLKKRMHGPSEQATTKRQLQAKDALFGLRAGLAGPLRTEVDRAIITWIVQDWLSRGGGEHSTTKIVGVLGKAAVPALIAGLGRDARALLPIAKLLKTHATLQQRERATKQLIARLQSPEAKPTQAAFDALGYLGTRAGHHYLLQVASAKHANERYRLWALFAVKMIPRKEGVATLVRLLVDTRLPATLRKASVEALEKIPGPATRAALGGIIAKNPNETLRYRAVEAIISCCKVEGVRQLLKSLPTELAYRRTDVQDLIEADIKKLGKAALPPLREALSSKSWIARVVAARLVGQLGDKGDVPALRTLVADRAKLNGWNVKGATVGQEARAALLGLEKK